MLDALFEYVAAGQPVVLTPFILMGAMSPVTIPAALVQQIAEALSGYRAGAADPAGLPGDLRVVPVEHRHAVRVADASGRRSRRSACSAPARSPGTSGCRSVPVAG